MVSRCHDHPVFRGGVGIRSCLLFDVGHVRDHLPLADCSISLAGCWCGASPRPLYGRREPRRLVAVQVLDCVEEHVRSEVQQRRPPRCRPVHGKVERE